MPHPKRMLPFPRVREVMQDHFFDVEFVAAFLDCGGVRRGEYKSHHDLRRSQRRNIGSMSKSRNTNPARLISAASRGSTALRLNHHATPPTAPKRSAIPINQPARNNCARLRTITRPANAINCNPYAMPAENQSAGTTA